MEESKTIRCIANNIYDLFVVNSGVIGVQMPDGKYIPQVINYDSTIFEKMIQKKMSLGIYQQQYRRNVTKWVCLDFDCNVVDDEKLPVLIETFVTPCINFLKENNIYYLLEFSGRRGIHIWIVFDTIISKTQAYRIVYKIKRYLISGSEKLTDFSIDIFPKIPGGTNKYGSMVKCPLSWHRKGKQSFLMSDISEFITATGLNFDVDFDKQMYILENYKKNNYYDVCNKLKITQEKQELIIPKYKMQRLVDIENSLSYSFLDIEKKCQESKVLHQILKKVREGSLRHLDRLILVSTFAYFNEELLYSFFELQNNYEFQKTKTYIDKYKIEYYPITMKYLYDLYCEELEDNINPNCTVLEFVCEKLKMPSKFIQAIIKNQQPPNSIKKIENIVFKEISYMKYNDEVYDIVDFYKISNLKKYDLEQINKICDNAMKRAEYVHPEEFKKYIRFEDDGKPPRMLISLSPQDRIITSYLIFELASIVNWRFDSFSYNINFLPSGDIFFPWFHSWRKFNESISTYINTGLFDELNVVQLDIKNFYDNIYFHSVYEEMLEELTSYKSKRNSEDNEKIRNIFKVLCKYNDEIMLKIADSVKGVPQGPAYARIMAEIFIASILRKFKNDNKGVIVIRYVDDMFILHDDSRNSLDLVKMINTKLLSKGLRLNEAKTKVYGKIGKMSQETKREICDINSNYDIKSIKMLDLESVQNKEIKISIFEKFISGNGEWIKDANFILNDYIEKDFINIYLKKYYSEIISSKQGRGSIFNKLYAFIFNDEYWLKRLLKERKYMNIPTKSINFKCFLNSVFNLIINGCLYNYTNEICVLVNYLLEKTNIDSYEESIINTIKEKWEEQFNEFRK